MMGQNVQRGHGHEKLGSSHSKLFSIGIWNLLFEIQDREVFVSGDLLEYFGRIKILYDLRG